jgi:hypothetical protein
MNDKDDEALKVAFDALKPRGKHTAPIADILKDMEESPAYQQKYPLAYQFLKASFDDIQGGVEYESFKDDLDYYFKNEEDDNDNEDEEQTEREFLDFPALKEKLSLFDTREKLEELWKNLRLEEHFTDLCKDYIIDGILQAKVLH